MAGARGQRAHAERARLLAGGARRRRCAALELPATRSRARSTGSATRCGACSAPGRAVVLTDGPDNAAYWEHDWLARAARRRRSSMPGDLELRGDRLLHGGDAGRRGLPPHERRRGGQRRWARCSTRSWRPAGVQLINCFGTGVADDKLAHAYVPRHDPLLPRRGARCSTRSRRSTSATPRTLERALDVFDELVIKDRGSYGGLGVVVCPHAERADVEELREQVRAAPGDYVAQRLVALSTHPTVIDGALAPRHVDLRPFVLMPAPDDVEVLPGGITRVALDEGALVVNSSQNGGAKDTWVVP